MERPSHIHFDTRRFSHRVPLIGLALSLQFATLWLFTHGLMTHWTKIVRGDIQVQFHEKQNPSLPPPEPPIPTRIEPPRVPIPTVDIDPGPQRNTIVATTAITPATNPLPPAAVVDRAPLSIIATHTVPPYPPIARRLGAEGKVTLGLTVTAEGHVAQADIVTSSGRDDLDQTAQQWIVAHWKYKPALANGVPAASHTLATVTFSLVNER